MKPVARAVLSFLALLAACDPKPAARVDVTLGARPEDRHLFTADAAFAEYVELSDGVHELTITLAGYKASCERFEPPPPGDVVVTVVALTPRGVAPGKGSFSWSGHEAHGGSPMRPNKPYAVPTVRVGPKSFPIEPGGALELSRVELSRDGRIGGLLKFESPGDGRHEATSIKGSFEVPLCRFRELPNRP